MPVALDKPACQGNAQHAARSRERNHGPQSRKAFSISSNAADYGPPLASGVILLSGRNERDISAKPLNTP